MLKRNEINMKLKGVNTLEQHIEKIILAVVLLILLGVLGAQFVLQPNNVEVGSRSVAPENVYTELQGEAQRIESQMKDPSPQLPEVAPMDLVAKYNEAFADSAQNTTQLSSALGRGVDFEGVFGQVDKTSVNSGPVDALRVPLTDKPIAVSSWSTLDPYVLQEVPEYASYMPDAQPFDFPSVSIEASFNGLDLQGSLDGESGNNGVPRKFWVRTGIAILGFEVERQELMPDGRWGASTPIDTPPMTAMPTGKLTPESGLSGLVELVSDASSAFDDIAQPFFPPTIAGVEWVPPSEHIEVDTSAMSEVDRVRRKLSRKESDLAKAEKQAGVANRNSGSRDPRSGGGGGKSVTNTGGGGGGNTPSRPTTADKLRIKIDKIKDDIKKYRDELKELGEDDEAINDAARAGRDQSIGVLDQENIQLWAHDLGVKPGGQYRYRSRVVVNNPLFRKGAQMDPEDQAQQALTKDPYARAQWSTWSDTVLVGELEYFFVSSAKSTGAHAETSNAKVEVYKMYYGHYRRSTIASIEPGARVQSKAAVSGRLLTIDTDAVESAAAGEQLNVLLTDRKAEVPEGFDEVSGRIVIDLGAYVLEIAPDPLADAQSGVGAVQPSEVVFRGPRGELIVRKTVSGDTESAAYKLVTDSSSQASRSPMRLTGESAVSASYELFLSDSEP